MNTPKRVLIFSLAYYPNFVSGAEVAIKEITDRIGGTDIEFHLITLQFDTNAPRTETIGTVTVHRVSMGPGYLSKILYIPLSVLKARALHQNYHFDALWSVMTYMLFPVVLAKMVGVRVPHILTLQDGDPYEKVFERWFILPVTPLLNYGFKTARAVQTISNYLANWPKRRGYPDSSVVIPNGADPDDVADCVTKEEVQELAKQLGKKEGDVFLVNTARLVHQKAQDDVIRALTKLPANIHFLIVGRGPDEKMLQGLVDQLHLEDRVIFAGHVPTDAVAKYRKVADIFVAPSRSEGLGNAFLSAMASRIPVIATQEGGLADFLFDTERNPDRMPTGFAVEPDSPEEIAEKVIWIQEHPIEVNTIVQNARKMVEEKYTWDVVAKEMREKIFIPVLTKE